MATDAPTPPAAASNKRPPLAPPEERFWIRYSPHQELPLSAASSFALHILVGGLLILAAVYLSRYFAKSSKPIPVEAVRLDLGGGGGNPNGVGNGPGNLGGGGGEATNQGEDIKAPPGTAAADPTRPELTAPENKLPPLDLSDPSYRPVSTSANKAYARLNQNLRETLRPRDPAPAGGPGNGTGDSGKGRSGPGKGGGAGRGTGTGTGDGTGPGKGTMTQRERRMLRWHMLFDTHDGADYLAQLRQLGAILAIPLNGGPNPEFGLVRDLRPPAQLVREDVRKVQRIYWIDDNPPNVRAIMAALGLRLDPPMFVAFMPEKLEQTLFEREKAYLERHYPGTTENQIELTKFKLRRPGLEPYVTEIVLKNRR